MEEEMEPYIKSSIKNLSLKIINDCLNKPEISFTVKDKTIEADNYEKMIECFEVFSKAYNVVNKSWEESMGSNLENISDSN